MVGLSIHNPAVIATMEGEGWDVDYHQTCLYRVFRTAEEARAEFGDGGRPHVEHAGSSRRCRPRNKRPRSPSIA